MDKFIGANPFSLEERLKVLLDWSYMKGQAYYRKDNYGASEDEDRDWDHYEEEAFQAQIKRFIKDYDR